MTGVAESVARGTGPPVHRMFFALWPDRLLLEALEARIPEFLRGVRGKPQRRDQWHLTLVFLGAVPADRLPLLEEAAGAVQGDPFEIRFDLAEHWRRPQVLCLSASENPLGLVRLVDDLRSALLARGFATEEREFRPHLTLARKVRHAPRRAEIEALHWPAADFALVESVTGPDGSRYSVRRRWPLARTAS